MDGENDKIIDLFTGQPMTKEDLEFTKVLEDLDWDDLDEGCGTVLNKEKWELYQRIARYFDNLLGNDSAILKVQYSDKPYPASDTASVQITFPIISTPKPETRAAIADAITVCDMFCVLSGEDKRIRMLFSVHNIWKDFGHKEEPEMDINPKNFKDIQILHRAIREFIMESPAYDEAEFDCDAAALYLAWFGLTDEQIKAYRKADVLDDGIMINGTKHTLPPEILNIFLRLRDSKGYYTHGGDDGLIFHAYEESDRLIRDAGK